MSRLIASYHPDVDKPWDGLSGAEAPTSGTQIVSEVHLLTGRLPWTRVSRKTRADRENNTLDNMRAICNRLRKGICSVSEAAAFGTKPSVPRTDGTAMEASSNPNSTAPMVSSVDGSFQIGEDKLQETARQADETTSPAPSRSQTPTLTAGDGTAQAPLELLSSEDDEDTASVMSESTLDGKPVKASVSVVVLDGAIASSGPSSDRNETGSAVKRKASQAGGLERRRSPHIPTPLESPTLGNSVADIDVVMASPSSIRPNSPSSPLSQASPTLTAIDVTENASDDPPEAEAQEGPSDRRGESAIDSDDEDDGADDQLTYKKAQKIVDSLWKACLFFSSPRRPRYSNVYGYNTFMITLTLHLLSMLETLKHLHRSPLRHAGFRRMRSNSDATSAATYDTETTSSNAGPQAAVSGRIDRVAMRIEVDGYEEEEDLIAFDEDEDYEIDHNYSLTEDAMVAMDLGTVLTDLGPAETGFD